MQQLGVKNDIAKLQQLLGSKLYSDKYSFISEVLQNSTDAMRKAGKVDQPFTVGIKLDKEFVFYVRDTGCSFDSIEDFKRLVGTLLESSKTQSKDSTENQEIGKFGIGSISVAAFTSTWYYKVYKNKKAFDATLMEVDGKGLFLETTDYYDTEEEDGVLVTVPIADKMVNSFYVALIQKAKYFQNIRFAFDSNAIEVIKSINWSNGLKALNINDNFVIYRNDLFQYSTLNELNELHICLDQYSYTINWSHLEMERIRLPFALRFSLDEFETNPTREVLSIDAGYKDRVISKINEFLQFIVDKYNEQNPSFEAKDYKQFLEEIDKRENKLVQIAEKQFDINFLGNNELYSFNLPTFKGITLVESDEFKTFIRRCFNSFYDPKYFIKGSRTRRDPGFTRAIDQDSDVRMFLIEKSLKRVHQDYFKTVDGRNYFFKKKENQLCEIHKARLGDVSLHGFLLDEMQGYDSLEDEYQSYVRKKKYELFTMLMAEYEKAYFRTPEQFVPADYKGNRPLVIRKSKVKVEKGECEIIVKYPRHPQKWTGYHATWEEKPVKVKGLKKLPALHIYGTEDKRVQLEQIFKWFKKVQTIMVNEKTEKIIMEENPHNFVNINSLIDNLQVVSKYVTASFIKKKLEPYEDLVDNLSVIRGFVSTKIADDLAILHGKLNSYDVDDLFYRRNSGDFMKEIDGLFANNPKLYNQEILYQFNSLEQSLKNLDFLPLFIDELKDPRNTKHEIAKATVREICRIRKVRMDWQNYTLDKIEQHFAVTTNE